jgi:hypothetical protein
MLRTDYRGDFGRLFIFGKTPRNKAGLGWRLLDPALFEDHRRDN